MPRICRLRNVTLYVHANDHAPPHFHVVGPNSNAQIRIDDLQILRGQIDRGDLVDVIAWAGVETHTEQLWRAWRDLHGEG